MSASIIDYVNIHTEKEKGNNKYIDDKFFDIKELNTESAYITKKLNLQGVVPADSYIGTDANFNVIEKILPTPSPYPNPPSCFGWYDSGFGVIPPNTNTSPNIIILSFLQTGGFPQYNNPISSSFVFNQTSGIFTCNESGVYLINQSYRVSAVPSPLINPFLMGIYNRTSGRYYKGANYIATPPEPMPNNLVYSNTTYDTFTAGTQLNIWGINADGTNSVNFDETFITFFRLA